MVPEGRARIAYGFAIANNKSFASSARNAFSLDARASRIVFVFRDRRGIVDSLTRRWSAERTLRDSAEILFFSAGTENESASVPTNACARGASFFYLGGVLGFWSRSERARRPFHLHRTSTMSASLCMSMASLAVSGSGRGVTAARMGRAAASKGAVAGSSAFFPAKASAKMTMKSSLAGACPPIPPTNAKPGTRGDATARATRPHEAAASPPNAPRPARPAPRVDGASDPGCSARGCREKASRRAPWLFLLASLGSTINLILFRTRADRSIVPPCDSPHSSERLAKHAHTPHI